MSAVHFALETDNETCHLRDLNSTNGTQLNGTPVTEFDGSAHRRHDSGRRNHSSPWTSKGMPRASRPALPFRRRARCRSKRLPLRRWGGRRNLVPSGEKSSSPSKLVPRG